MLTFSTVKTLMKFSSSQPNSENKTELKILLELAKVTVPLCSLPLEKEKKDIMSEKVS